MDDQKFEALPKNRADLQSRWPLLLADIIEKSKSPVDPEELAAELRKNEKFTALIDGWENMPTTAQANAWIMIRDRLWDAALSYRQYCLRCGECCRRGSPVVFDQDRPMLHDGIVKPAQLMTLRRGEAAWSNHKERMIILAKEQVKLKESPNQNACLFLSDSGDACRIYEDRPFQCRVMECWDSSRFETVLKGDPLTRLDILGEDTAIGRVVQRHEERCDLGVFAKALRDLKQGDRKAGETALEMIRYDIHVREFVTEQFGIDEEEMDFYLGRPLAYLCQGWGYKLHFDPANQPMLAPMDDTTE